MLKLILELSTVIPASLSIASVLMMSIWSSFSFSTIPFSIAAAAKEFSIFLQKAFRIHWAESSREQLELLANKSTIMLMIDPPFDNSISYRFKFVAKGIRRNVPHSLEFYCFGSMKFEYFMY